jgi:hypothetical protein
MIREGAICPVVFVRPEAAHVCELYDATETARHFCCRVSTAATKHSFLID